MNYEMYLEMNSDIKAIENHKTAKGSMALFNRLMSKYKVYDESISSKVHEENKASFDGEFDYLDELSNLKEVLKMYMKLDKVDTCVETEKDKVERHINEIRELITTGKIKRNIYDYYVEITSYYINLIPGFGDNCYDYFSDNNFFDSEISESSIIYNSKVFLPKIEHYYNVNCINSNGNYNFHEILMNIFENFEDAAEVLSHRRNNKSIIKIEDEYDVQDLLHVMLRAQFSDIVPEEFSPNFGGIGSRIDFYTKKFKAAIEVKCTRDGLNDKELLNQLLDDISKYNEHPEVEKLYFFIYDKSHHIRNHINIKNDLEKNNKKIIVYFCR